jgi:hypothetical protein
MDAADRALLAATVGDAIAGFDAHALDGEVDEILDGLGWPEMLASEPRDAIAIVFGALGSTNHTASVLDDVIAGALGFEPGPDRAVLLPPFATWNPPGRIAGEHVSAAGLATTRVVNARELLVVCGEEPEVRAVAVSTADADVSAVGGVDPDAGLHVVRVELDGAGAHALQAGAWESAVALGQRAVAHQIAGASRAMLDLAREHARERVQFGRPIARFQAVRHRLADALVAIEALDATLDAAGDEPAPLTAALAKAVAGRTARTVGGHCQQVLAGIGFTTDHPFHRYLKRTMALEGMFGSADEIAVAIGRQLLASRRVPTLIEL